MSEWVQLELDFGDHECNDPKQSMSCISCGKECEQDARTQTTKNITATEEEV